MTDPLDRNITIDALQAALPDADWTVFNAWVGKGYEFLRTTLIWGKVYWWMRNAHHHVLISSPLTGQDAEILKTAMEEVTA